MENLGDSRTLCSKVRWQNDLGLLVCVGAPRSGICRLDGCAEWKMSEGLGNDVDFGRASRDSRQQQSWTIKRYAI